MMFIWQLLRKIVQLTSCSHKMLVNLIVVMGIVPCSVAQVNQNISVGIDEYSVLYRGYPNILHLANYEIIRCQNCSFQKKDSSGNYEVKPGNGKFAVIDMGTISIREKDTIRKILKSNHYQIRRLPPAQLFLGDKSEGVCIDENDTLFSVSYGPGVPLEVTFNLVSWTATFEGDTVKYTGNGEKLSTDLRSALSKVRKRTQMKVEGYYNGGGAYAILVKNSFIVKR
jgi:hypothetical protein